MCRGITILCLGELPLWVRGNRRLLAFVWGKWHHTCRGNDNYPLKQFCGGIEPHPTAQQSTLSPASDGGEKKCGIWQCFPPKSQAFWEKGVASLSGTVSKKALYLANPNPTKIPFPPPFSSVKVFSPPTKDLQKTKSELKLGVLNTPPRSPHLLHFPSLFSEFHFFRFPPQKKIWVRKCRRNAPQFFPLKMGGRAFTCTCLSPR